METELDGSFLSSSIESFGSASSQLPSIIVSFSSLLFIRRIKIVVSACSIFGSCFLGSRVGSYLRR